MVLNKPQNFSVSPNGDSQMDLAWDDISGEEEYRVYRFTVNHEGPIIDDSALEFFLPLNEGSGSVSSDVSGNGYSADHYNSPVWTDGAYDKALQMNGTDQGMNAGKQLDLTGWTELTYEMMVSVDTSRKLKFVLDGGNGQQTLKTDSYFSSSEWQHVFCVLTASAGTMEFYIDNTLDSSLTFDSSQLKSGNHMFAVPLTDPAFLHGEMSDIRLYSRELSSSERQRNFEASYSRIATPAKNSTSYSDTGLGGTTYYYVASGYDTSTGEGEWPAALNDSLIVSPPSDVTVNWSVSDEEVTVDFTEDNTNWTYEVERQDNEDGTWDAVASPGSPSITDTTPTGVDNKYEYRVRSVTTDGVTSSWTTIPIYSTPNQPSTLQITDDTGGQTDLAWTDNSKWETGFRIYRWSEENDTYSLIGSSSTINFVDASPPENTVTKYKVKAYAQY